MKIKLKKDLKGKDGNIYPKDRWLNARDVDGFIFIIDNLTFNNSKGDQRSWKMVAKSNIKEIK
jgi:hypothetical protein